MNISDIFALMPKLLPLMPDIEKMIATAQRLEADPDLKAALATAEKLAQIFAQSGIKE